MGQHIQDVAKAGNIDTALFVGFAINKCDHYGLPLTYKTSGGGLARQAMFLFASSRRSQLP